MFVKATALAQRTHAMGAFDGVAVGLALGWTMLQTIFGGKKSAWRAGDAITIRHRSADGTDHAWAGAGFVLLASTLKRLPLGLRPFGRMRQGLKLLTIDAPPRWIAAAVPMLLAGSEARWLERSGYHRIDAEAIELDLDSGYILDGEPFDGGALTLRQAAPVAFVVP